MGFGEALGRFAQTDPKDELVKSPDGKVRLVEDSDTGDRLLIYLTPQGLRIEAIYDGNEIRMTQAQMARLFGRDQSVIARHLKRVEQMDGLPPETLYADSAYKGAHDQTYHRRLYTVDAINYVGFRVNSPQGILFRRWASDALGQIITKGFYIDKDRLKAPQQQSILDELRDTIREIGHRHKTSIAKFAEFARCARTMTDQPRRPATSSQLWKTNSYGPPLP